jgi:uncharacterized protein involved in type VI secretion and phage assembly
MLDLAELLSPAQSTARAAASTAFVMGKVIENNQNQFAGMVKVEYIAWEAGKSVSDWMPVLQHGAGPNYGTFSSPELDEIVLVGFLGHSNEQPFVLGSFFPGGAQLPGQAFYKENRHETYITKGQVVLDIMDEDNKQRVSVTTPKGITMVLEDEKETAKISDKSGKNFLFIDCKNGEVTVTADTKLTLRCGGTSMQFTAAGAKVDLECAELTMNASRTAKIASKVKMDLETTTFNAQGKAQATLMGGSLGSVSGRLVKFNCAA